MQALLKSLALAAGAQAFGSQVEEAPYTVLETDGDFELRQYPTMNIVESDDDFMKLFSYISGDNADNEEIPMTAPVFKCQDASQEQMMAFVMPADMTQVPQPDDSTIEVS